MGFLPQPQKIYGRQEFENTHVGKDQVNMNIKERFEEHNLKEKLQIK